MENSTVCHVRCGTMPRTVRASCPRHFTQGARLYEKPVLRRFGDLRSLTLIGLGPDGDGGIFGTGYIDGCQIGCSGRS